jgi:membrane protease YdiL (CAAX protease family)
MDDERDQRGRVLNRRRALIELVVAAGGLTTVVLLVPLGSPYFGWVSLVCCLAVVGYVAYGLISIPGAAEHWHLIPPATTDPEGCRFGCGYVAALLFAGLIPIVAMKLLVELPFEISAWSYLAWCVVQDFVFFSIILRNLAYLTDPLTGILGAAVCFGASHYPFGEFMAATAVIGLLWGYLFVTTRWLLFVTASHWMMGLLLLG